MPLLPDTDPDSTLDRLFQGQRPVRQDFTERTLARIQAAAALEEDTLDERLDAWLASVPVTPADDFTERTVSRIRRAPAPVIRFPLPLLVRTAAGIAAAIALLLVVGRNEVHAPAESVQMANALTHEASTADRTLESDAALATLLMLAEGLDKDARWLVHGGETTAFLTLAH